MTSKGAEVSAVPTASVVPPSSIPKGKRSRQRPLGPAPFASFEDSSDELDSPPESSRAPGLPNIKEDPASQLATPVTSKPPDMNQLNLTEEEERGLQEALNASLDMPAPPRIDISRASSSSQHEDSITSSPDGELGHNLGYKEDGTLELKSSTEELHYVQEPGTVEEGEAKRRRERRMQKQVRQDFGDTQSEHGDVKERKDSNCSVASDFGGHLYIGGRTSRLSSVGSAASGNSVASGVSHLSGTSRLSATSKMSRGSRSPSPHKMMLETSFCGDKPAAGSHVVDAQSAPALVSHMEKPSSRPPSRLRSRSPSPHKMLLETSFCGTKSIGASEAAQENTIQGEARRRSSNTLSAIVTTADIETQPQERSKTSTPDKAESTQRKTGVTKRTSIPRDTEEIQKADEIKPVKVRHRKPVNLAQMMERKIQAELNKPKKKVVSLRDIPGDEIIIPLTGPEVDFEELIRKSSPNMPRKEPSVEHPDYIYIPLHSPPKEKAVETQFKASDPIPIKGSRSPNKEPKPYEVCEDGSIFIPLHTPEEEKNARSFEEQIRRVERELQRVKAAEAERRERERGEQQKPATLDLTDNTNSRSRLSSSYPGKQDLLSGSRTPSPGSSLSRKSSFASIFRRSELTASPDSPAGHSARKKSGTLSNILNPSDGSRERSRSRSKDRSRERLSSTSLSRSPSFKKNLLGNLFGGKKKEEARESRQESETPRREVHTVISTAKFQGQDMGDYILIPLKDPSQYGDHYSQDNLEDASTPETLTKAEVCQQQELKNAEVEDAKVGSYRRSRDLDEDADIRSQKSDISTFHLSTVGNVYKSPLEEKPAMKIADSPVLQTLPSSFSKQSLKSQKEAPLSQAQHIASTPEPTSPPVDARPSTPPPSPPIQQPPSPPALESSTSPAANDKGTLKPHGQESSVQDSSVDLDEDLPREEIVTVSTDGIRKLKLPPEPGDLEEDHERKGLVVQDSMEDELPYVPTTLPQERSLGVTLVPAKERMSEVVTCPIDRPRCTTPKNPASLQEFLITRDSSSIPDKEKMKISLPRVDSTTGKVKSPRRFSGGKTWFEFAEAGIPSPRDGRKNSLTKSPSPPPLPPRADQSATTPQDLTDCAPSTPGSAWINFEELPEKRKLPKRITTLPVHRGPTDGAAASDKASAPAVYSYVNPEDCQCECHDHKHDTHLHTKLVAGMQERGRRMVQVCGDTDCEQCECGEQQPVEPVDDARQLEECPLLDGSDDESISRRENDWILPGSRLEVDQPPLSDSSFEAMSIGPDQSPVDNNSEMIPFAMDLDVHSNRSSIISQNDDISPDQVS